MAEEKFCLRWNDFESNLSTAFKELKNDQDLFDITLVCEDDQLKAHKLILSACSPFFRKVLLRNPHQHPLLYMKGMMSSNMQSVLDFMYLGEVSVAQEELNCFLAVAEDLKVKGLSHKSPTEAKNSTNTEENFRKIPLNRLNQTEPTSIKNGNHTRKKVETTDYKQNLSKEYAMQVTAPVKLESDNSSNFTYQSQGAVVDDLCVEYQPTDAHSQSVTPYHEEDQEIYDENYAEYEEDQINNISNPNQTSSPAMFQNYIVKSSNGQRFQCTICGKESAQKGNLGKHVENVHFPSFFSYDCKYCSQSFNTKNKLYVHIARTHK